MKSVISKPHEFRPARALFASVLVSRGAWRASAAAITFLGTVLCAQLGKHTLDPVRARFLMRRRVLNHPDGEFNPKRVARRSAILTNNIPLATSWSNQRLGAKRLLELARKAPRGHPHSF